MKQTNATYPTHNQEFFSPPRQVTVDGVCTPIRWDFQTAFRFMEYVDKSEDDDEVFLKTVLDIWYPTVPENRDAAMEAALCFYCAGSLPKEGYYRPLFRPEDCREEIYLDFLQRYGIDLNRDHIHWWIFRRLLANLEKKKVLT